ncbi:N-acetylmuramoyl-L-alanine amidase [Nocardioides albertanoniae]|uniref:N-acetylmuramoyl-L-alanine amidase n=1 Tax=Nocardioides albertanoniae TaxID=1175486 RepID=A0A543ABX3_9ACTN|nr:N-acetylmuramoyl-L-alanine amidase [Nocardioides albertanoniae]TQL70057.1 N-acetylmuramoyl-L-alanine amidase [Nocardioides albertanoniae]
MSDAHRGSSVESRFSRGAPRGKRPLTEIPRSAATAVGCLALASALTACTPGRTPQQPAASGSPSTSSGSAAPSSSGAPEAAGDVFDGAVIGIDPGHNAGNAGAPEVINKQVWNGRSKSPCNTTGTATDDGYPETDFTWAVANKLAADLREAGAEVVMTRDGNDGVGPCIDKRAKIINDAKADVAIDIHADGAAESERGFSLLIPVRSGTNDKVVQPSRDYAEMLRTEMKKTGMPLATYLGEGGFVKRDDLAGLNLTTVPQVLLETGNMRNAEDARLLKSDKFHAETAAAIMRAMAAYLRSR